MAMRIKRVVATGQTPLIMHRENFAFANKLLEWRQNPANVGKQVKGDDRSPGWTWIGGVYHDGNVVGIPSDNLMTMLREGGAKVSTGKRSGTFKRQSQSGLIVMEPLWPIVTARGVTIRWADVERLFDVDDFEANIEAARKVGFDDILVKRVNLQSSKPLRARAWFAAGWKIEGTIAITDDTITDRVFNDILDAAGSYCGLLDWRPSSKQSPGPYGRFTVEVFDK